MSSDDAAQQIYERLWAETSGPLATGAITLDKQLVERAADRRRGITLIARPGPAAITRIAGFVEGDRLNQLREAIRSALGRAGLGESLDARYRIVTAHATIMRFRVPLRNPPQLAA